MRKRIEFHRFAAREAAEARAWYAVRSAHAVRRFMAELDRAVDEVSETPERFPEYLSGTRRHLFWRFPYLLVYRMTADGVQVIAVAHAKRRPGYWSRRK